MATSSKLKTTSSKAKVAQYRARLRAQGLRPIQIWVPDLNSPSFQLEARRQSTAVAQSGMAKIDQDFIASISEYDSK